MRFNFTQFYGQKISASDISKKLAKLLSALVFLAALMPMQQTAAQSTGSSSTGSQNPCADNPCLNGGTCIQLVDSFMCSCVSSYIGSTCGFFYDEAYMEPIDEPVAGPVPVTSPTTVALYFIGLAGLIGVSWSRRKPRA
jgi:hypothetical protein